MKINRPNVSPPPSPTTSTARSAPTSPTAPTSPSAPPQRTQATGPTAPPPVTDSLSPTMRPSAKGGVNLSGTTAPPPAPPPPPAPRPPVASASGQPPRSVNASLQDELNRASLKPANHGVVHPDLPGIRTHRNPMSGPHEYADFTRDARASTHRLMETPTGNQMLTDINNSTGRLNPGATGTPQKPLTAVDIHSSNRMTHQPRTSGNTAEEQLASARPAYRFDGQPGTGAASTVKYNPNGGRSEPGDVALRPGDFRANSLGHEMVHAHRAAHGVQVAPLEASKHAQNPMLKKYDPQTPGDVNYPKQVINQHALLKEEFETVGLQRTPGRPDAPTEKMIRKELGMPPRTNYSGEVPGGANHQELKRVDEHLDNRLGVSKRYNLTESPVTKIVNHLEK